MVAKTLHTHTGRSARDFPWGHIDEVSRNYYRDNARRLLTRLDQARANRTIGPNGPTMPAPVFETSRTNQTTPNRTVGPDPLDCPACGYDPMAPHNGKGDCAADRKTGCRDCGCPDRSDDHLREEWSCGCRCHTDRTIGTSDE